MPPTVPLPTTPALPAVLEFLRVLWSLNHALEITSSEMLRSAGITAQQRMVLRIVGHIGPTSAGRLSDVLRVHPGTLSAALGRLERRGLVRRERGATDARRIVVSLTGAGETLLATTEGTVERATTSALEHAGTVVTEHTLQLLTRLTAELEGAHVARASATRAPDES